MKSLSLLLTAAIATTVIQASAINCLRQEAQVIGTITEVFKNGCEATAKFTYYNEHTFCPLNREEVTHFTIPTCKAEVGTEVSGILVRENNIIVLEH